MINALPSVPHRLRTNGKLRRLTPLLFLAGVFFLVGCTTTSTPPTTQIPLPIQAPTISNQAPVVSSYKVIIAPGDTRPRPYDESGYSGDTFEFSGRNFVSGAVVVVDDSTIVTPSEVTPTSLRFVFPSSNSKGLRAAIVGVRETGWPDAKIFMAINYQ